MAFSSDRSPRTLGCAPVCHHRGAERPLEAAWLAGQSGEDGGPHRPPWPCGCSDGTVSERCQEGPWRPEEPWQLPEGVRGRACGSALGKVLCEEAAASAAQRPGQALAIEAEHTESVGLEQGLELV